MNNSKDIIIFFDSGVGGISVLREARKKLPSEKFVYFGDNKNAPYGEKNQTEILVLVQQAIKMLQEKYQPKAVVLACNTATAVAIEALRKENPNLILIGMEPEIKNALRAVEDDKKKKVLVMATKVTGSLPKYQSLKNELDAHKQIITIDGGDLVRIIETGRRSEEIEDELNKIWGQELRQEKIGAVVLGCTHYNFAMTEIVKLAREIWGNEVMVLNGVAGTVNELQRQLVEKNLTHKRDWVDDERNEERVVFVTSGEDEKYLPLMVKFLE